MEVHSSHSAAMTPWAERSLTKVCVLTAIHQVQDSTQQTLSNQCKPPEGLPGCKCYFNGDMTAILNEWKAIYFTMGASFLQRQCPSSVVSFPLSFLLHHLSSMRQEIYDHKAPWIKVSCADCLPLLQACPSEHGLLFPKDLKIEELFLDRTLSSDKTTESPHKLRLDKRLQCISICIPPLHRRDQFHPI